MGPLTSGPIIMAIAPLLSRFVHFVVQTFFSYVSVTICFISTKVLNSLILS